MAKHVFTGHVSGLGLFQVFECKNTKLFKAVYVYNKVVNKCTTITECLYNIRRVCLCAFGQYWNARHCCGDFTANFKYVAPLTNVSVYPCAKSNKSNLSRNISSGSVATNVFLATELFLALFMTVCHSNISLYHIYSCKFNLFLLAFYECTSVTEMLSERLTDRILFQCLKFDERSVSVPV